jgi:hypothetical protein
MCARRAARSIQFRHRFLGGPGSAGPRPKVRCAVEAAPGVPCEARADQAAQERGPPGNRVPPSENVRFKSTWLALPGRLQSRIAVSYLVPQLSIKRPDGEHGEEHGE